MPRRYPNSEQLLTQAVDATRLSDFGPGDFADGLAVLLDSLEADGDLDPAADESVLATLRRRLINRLEVEQWYRDHPSIDDLAVRGPVDINGLPRTGTTALANILSLDPQFRSLRGWEQSQPVPPPTTAGEATDPRRLQLARDYEHLPPEIHAMHLFELDATMEDSDVLGMAFHGQQYTLPVFSYHDWWRDADLTATYRYHRRVVKLLHSQRPPDRWLFKAPHHKFHLEAFVAAYPEARFVMTHRDPAKVVPSYASLVSNYFPPAASPRDLRQLGPRVSEHLRAGMEHAIAARARLGEERFLDVHHRELAADPLAVIERVYAFLELDPPRSFERTVEEWHAANRLGARGTHHYTPEQFGVSAARVRGDYDFYIRHFDIELED